MGGVKEGKCMDRRMGVSGVEGLMMGSGWGEMEGGGYVSEMGEKGNMKLEVLEKGKRVVRGYKGREENGGGKKVWGEGWMKKLVW